VIARTSAVVEPGGVLGELECAPPVTLRQVYGDTERCELCLVGTAAGPLAGDELSMWLRLRPGARAALRATGASLAQGRGPGTAALLSVRADLAERADLVADPGPLIICHGGRVDVRLELALGAAARIEWRELIVLGRTGEPPGQATVRWDVTRLGRPVLRQLTDLSGPELAARAGLTAGRRVLACALISDPARPARTVAAGPAAVAQRVNDHTVLVTVLGDDAATAAAQLAELCAVSAGDDLEGGQRGIGRVGDPAAVGGNLAQRG
jgi:urease accessory protein